MSNIKEKIEKLKDGKYYHVDLKRAIPFNKRTQCMYIFYFNLRLACNPNSSNIKTAFEELNATTSNPID